MTKYTIYFYYKSDLSDSSESIIYCNTTFNNYDNPTNYFNSYNNDCIDKCGDTQPCEYVCNNSIIPQICQIGYVRKIDSISQIYFTETIKYNYYTNNNEINLLLYPAFNGLEFSHIYVGNLKNITPTKVAISTLQQYNISGRPVPLTDFTNYKLLCQETDGYVYSQLTYSST